MHDLSISLFGTPQILRGNEQLSIQRRKDLALLIYLVVTSQPHSRDTLANLLWPDLNQTDARSNLRKSLSRLKTQLGEELLVISQSQAAINSSLPIQLDVARFEMDVRRFREHGHRRNGHAPVLCADCERSLEEAAQLYRADFLEGFGVLESSVFEEWQFFQTESLRKSLGEILELLTYQHAYREDFPGAIEHCRRWLSLDRLHEPAHRQLILLYALSGQQGAAVRQFEECERLLKDELDTAPEAETLELYEAIKQKRVRKAGRPSTSDRPEREKPGAIEPEPAGHHLPTHPAPFIGRQKELEELHRLVNEVDCRLLTLLGPGGNGKTRLAVQFASAMQNRSDTPFRDGVWFVPLAPLGEGQSILSALSDSLQVAGHRRGTDIRQKLLGHLRGRQVLLILDNFEHLLTDGNVGLIADISSVAPQSRVLVTSRERLNIQGETIFRVEGLEIPTTGSTLSESSSALQLFEQCARRVQHSFKISGDNYSAIVHICRHVQGMPLAIELAASWLEVLSLEEIHAEITRSLDFLESDRRDLPNRQRSLRAVFDSSWNMLDRQTRPVLKALSIFRTSFTREAAQTVSGASVKALLVLTNKSWIQRLSDGRYQIHELLKQFAYEKLSSEPAAFEQVHKQFCEYYAVYTRSLWEMMKGPQQRQSFSGIDSEFDNIHTAWMWMAARKNLEPATDHILPMLVHYCESRGRVQDLTGMLENGLRALEQETENPATRRLEIILRTAKGSFHYDGFPLRAANFDGLFPIDLHTVRRAWSLAQEINFDRLGFWGILLAYIYGRLIDLDEGLKRLKQMIPAFEEKGMPWELANSCMHLVKLLNYRRENPPELVKDMPMYLSKAMELFTEVGDIIHTGYTSSQWGEMKFNEDDLVGAIQQWKEARSSLLAAGEWATATDIMWRMADIYLQLGSFQEAFACYREIAQNYFEHHLREHAVSALSKESFEKVRYGDLTEALQLRQQCLDLIGEGGPAYQVAWNYWEMGELQRVASRPEEAREWYERSQRIFEDYQDDAGKSFYYRGLGDISIQNEDYTAAQDYFSKSAKLGEDSKHTWTIIYALTGLGRSKMGLKEYATSGKHLEKAASLTLRARDKGVTMVVLTALAELYGARGETVKAIELAALVESHFSSWNETRRQAAALLTALKKSVPAADYEQARKSGQAREIWYTVRQLAEK